MIYLNLQSIFFDKFMNKIKQIEHQGFVKNITDNEMKVSILSQSSCASCKVKSSCGVSDTEEKIVNVFIQKNHNYKIGEKVKVYYKQSLGFRALFFGYVLPFLILMFALVITLSITENEIISAIVAFTALLPYYLILYFNKKKLKNTFSFSIKK